MRSHIYYLMLLKRRQTFIRTLYNLICTWLVKITFIIRSVLKIPSGVRKTRFDRTLSFRVFFNKFNGINVLFYASPYWNAAVRNVKGFNGVYLVRLTTMTGRLPVRGSPRKRYSIVRKPPRNHTIVFYRANNTLSTISRSFLFLKRYNRDGRARQRAIIFSCDILRYGERCDNNTTIFPPTFGPRALYASSGPKAIWTGGGHP